ncbi:hypothetical protein EDB85DRAFT_2150221 [Lactarius pseudohatsudake]|nr:hypothetical protein EDB85DRAFT_2150221 [Lactarius pseudohatsudake]
MSLLRACEILEPEYTLKGQAIKHLSMNAVLLEISGPLSTEIISSRRATTRQLNKCRQAPAGIIPPLMRVIASSSPRRQFAFTILCDLALFWHGFKRRQLGERTSWRDPSKLLDVLLKCFSVNAGSFENLLDPFLKICPHSTPIAIGIAMTQFFRRVTEKLSNSKAVVKLLRILCASATAYTTLRRKDGAVLVRELAREIT